MKDLIELFKKNNVSYVLVGGFAVNYYGYIRTTQDIDFLVYPSKKNAERVMKALNEFGFGEAGIPKEFFEKGGSAVHLGVEPNRIDLLTHLKGISNDQIFQSMENITIENVRVNIIGIKELIMAKQSSDRPRDQADADELRKSQNNSTS